MKKNSKKILICGGAGFMGSHFTRHIYTKYPKYKIYNYDLLTYAGNLDNLRDIVEKEKKLLKKNRRYKFIKGDINDKVLLESLIKKEQFDVVINFAAESHVDRSILNAIEFIRTNIQGAYILLDLVYRLNVPRYIYISTDEIYGDIPMGRKATELSPLQPTNPYSASKASADLMVQSYIKTHKVPAIILRSSNNYGTHQNPEKLHSLVITNLLEGKQIPIHGKGNHERSWLNVKDFCTALDLILHKGKSFEIYNVSGEEKNNLEVIRTIARILKVNYKKFIYHVHDRPGPDFRYAQSHKKITRELGWKPLNSYKESIGDIISWYETNVKWWKKIKKNPDFSKHYDKQAKGYYTFEEAKNYHRHWVQEDNPDEI
ncbi:dTDP-glucose 4,6-dehydratase [Candidatus Roizmanbacteria bacterium RIFCSPLOWO2_12_FULL_40_12]|uniref:dTDP-glucose 4,6-dehydratase n=1 Tax=Candidatus Roizmanbacteria bacterium RIFCSPLOWO2_01_FULL_40_42 TaxID=1802066 RepID=A0A1F7J5F5_9BACT|nr:MAG: dTDP-glucose 4,6-dehydratase [Candidatus Roizmanbacteria bacterium RIFCSPHIGHO2_01_FULL_40_98]OGK28272.1 MAG: dTDP-glucose 4,6-dehydratase [Candidatus Roizmanbacteria bacterium RIFCSPHIGHO2_02_FULL_40_53]OGK30508.1 MAG: dTDP-glucose 4,6-dehydratase [Candidatus Roizmanbacteria bacterium RIFCSPHIGHO2_12_41_18]OGK36922.1 MAG: dTDP-glucose 4,6-dehydratase [Candidatus Roizmanbacteria bacterium RIFCSPHIGHO2_12_FULL_40_130]OGK50828.1 MAG: dTDP-glucose 4,6-dehydratase [Candidatus Roizmanbacteri